MKTLILIPVRMASTRFPNKPMALIAGKPMVQRVWEQAILSNIGPVIVACGDKRIADAVERAGGQATIFCSTPSFPAISHGCTEG